MRLSTLKKTNGVAPWVKEKGYCQYELLRPFQRGAPINALNKHMTYWRYFSTVWKGKYEMYPLMAFMGVVGCGIVTIITHSLQKPDIMIDRSKKEAPWDWSRLKDGKYKKNHARFFTFKDNLAPDLPDYVIDTQDRMLEAARRLGTR